MKTVEQVKELAISNMRYQMNIELALKGEEIRIKLNNQPVKCKAKGLRAEVAQMEAEPSANLRWGMITKKDFFKASRLCI
jgi:hypothetical protein